MKLLISSFVTSILISSNVQADVFYKTAKVVEVEPVYNYVLVDNPTTVCNNVQVPIYSTVEKSGNAAGGALTGMIIGGLIGKGATGQDDGAAAGAIIGGLIGADQGAKPKTESVVIGYTTERKCSKIIKTQEVRKLVGYNVTYEWASMQSVYFSPNRVSIGDKIDIKVNIDTLY